MVYFQQGRSLSSDTWFRQPRFLSPPRAQGREGWVTRSSNFQQLSFHNALEEQHDLEDLNHLADL